jgi:hypothetical protein
MVPPWVPDVTEPEGETAPPSPEGANQPVQPLANPASTNIAPPGRFMGANRNIGGFARSGDRSDMRRALGHYVRKGYGGHSTTTQRMGSTIHTADALYTALGAGDTNPYTQPGAALDPALIAGKSSDEIMDALVEVVCPVNGTQDIEASRNSIKDALSELLQAYPDADLLNLEPEQRNIAIERFVALDVFRRIDLDIGKTVREKAPNAIIGLERLKDIRDYVRETVSDAFRNLRNAGLMLSANRIMAIVKSALSETFSVFEGYAE